MRRFERTCYGRFAIFFRGIWISIVTLAVLLADAAPAWTGEPEVDFLVLEASECFVTARAKAGGSTDHESDGEGGPCELAGLRETTDRVANAFEFTFCDDFSSRSVSSGGFVQLRGASRARVHWKSTSTAWFETLLGAAALLVVSQKVVR